MDKKFSLKDFFMGSINKKIITLFLVLSIVPLLISTFLFYSSFNLGSETISETIKTDFSNHMESHATQDLELLSKNIKKEIQITKELFEVIAIKPGFETVLKQANETAEINENRFYPKEKTEWNRLQEYFKQVYEKEKNKMDMIRLFHSNGFIVNGVIDGKEDSSDFKGDKSWFKNTLNPEILESNEVYISSISIARKTNSPAIRYSKAIEVDGNRLGLFVINFKAESITEELERYSFGEKGYGMLIDLEYETAEGEILGWPVLLSRSTPAGDHFYLTENESKKAPVNKNQFNEENGKFTFTENEVKWIAFYKKIDLPEKKWILIVFTPEEELYELAVNASQKTQGITETTLFEFLILIFATIIIVLFAGTFFVDSITYPIQELTKTTKEIEKGNFKARAKVETGDELEELSITLNKSISALERMDEEKNQLDKAKTEFLSITSHELRSPMTPMKAQLQMLLENYYGEVNEKQKEALDIVLRNTIRLDKIIMDFLEISRIEAARLKFRFINTSLNEYIDRTIDEMNEFAPEKKIKIKKEISDLPIIEVDPDRVMQVLRNLINNAKKFSPENSTITVKAEVKNEFIEFMVKDEGIGISEKEQQRLFEPFYQAEQTIYRKYSGTGLGLAICKGIIEAQNGKIWLESTEGKGTSFYFTVPLTPVLEIKPIKVLFSSQEKIKTELKKAFINFLGPLGEPEFNSLNEFTKSILENYVDSLISKGIMDELDGKRFKEEILNIIGVKPADKAELTKEKINYIFSEEKNNAGDKNV